MLGKKYKFELGFVHFSQDKVASKAAEIYYSFVNYVTLPISLA